MNTHINWPCDDGEHLDYQIDWRRVWDSTFKCLHDEIVSLGVGNKRWAHYNLVLNWPDQHERRRDEGIELSFQYWLWGDAPSFTDKIERIPATEHALWHAFLSTLDA